MITVQVTGQDKVIEHLRAMTGGVRRALVRAVTAETIRVQARVREKLTGPVLKERTHRLHDSIHPSVEESGHAVIGKVGTNVVYAAFHEYGFHGVEQVKDHIRRISVAFGRPIATVEAHIRAHQRRVDYPARSFLRSTLGEMEPEIRARLEAAASEGLKDGAP